MRVGVHVGVGPHQRSLLAQGPDHGLVGLEDLQPFEVRHLGSEAAPVVHWADHGDADSRARHLVVLAEPGRHVDYSRPLFGGHEVLYEHHEGAGCGCEPRKQRLITALAQVSTGNGADAGRPFQLLFVAGEDGFPEREPGTVPLEHRVGDVGTDRARFDGRVQGVVVHTHSCSGPATSSGAAPEAGSKWKATVTAGSWRSR